VNEHVDWLPGNKPKLNEDQLKQAFFHSMPFAWRECFKSTGHAMCAMTIAKVSRCFRQQEKVATRRQIENEMTQRRASEQVKTQTNSAVDVQEDIDPHDPSKPSSLKKTTPAAARKRKTDPCPMHDHPHAWVACHSNQLNGHCQKRIRRDQDKKKDNNDSKKSTNQFTTCLSSEKGNTSLHSFDGH
jgi:hypothetical protein